MIEVIKLSETQAAQASLQKQRNEMKKAVSCCNSSSQEEGKRLLKCWQITS